MGTAYIVCIDSLWSDVLFGQRQRSVSVGPAYNIKHVSTVLKLLRGVARTLVDKDVILQIQTIHMSMAV